MAKRGLSNQSFQRHKLAKTKARREKFGDERRAADSGENTARNDLLPQLQIDYVPLASLEPSSHRTRRTTQAQLARVVGSIADMGFSQPILIAGYEIIDGNVRVEGARQLGLDVVPAIDCAHLSPLAVRKLRLAINRIGELGEWDLDLLKLELAELIDLDVDLAATGFTGQEIDIIVLDEDADEEDEEHPSPPDTPVSQLGDIWQLGAHRILCGSALEAASYETLLDGEPVHAVLTDPPYNVKIFGNVSGLGKVKHTEFAMASGELSREEFRGFLLGFLERLKPHLLAGSAVFAFMDWRSIDLLLQAGDAAGFSRLNICVWFKSGGGMGGFYRSAHELVAVFCAGEKLRTNNVGLGRHGRDRTNVWVAPGANRRGSSANEMLGAHATPKPVELLVDALLDVTNRGEHVLDPFLGSGSTLIAAEKSGRTCFGIELEPGFVDVAVQRWARLTGAEPVLLATGEIWEDVAEQRHADAAMLAATSTPLLESR